MNRSVLMIMGGALMVAIVVAMLVQAKLGKKAAKEVDVSNQILVTNKQIFTGEKLTPENVHWEPWASGGMYKGVFKREDYPDDNNPPEIYDTPLRRTLEAGEPVTTQALIPDIKGGNNFLAATISPGMRAVGLRVDAITSVGGFVSPGDHVDILLAYQPALPDQMQETSRVMFGRFASQTVLSNIKVLAVDQSFKDENREAKVSKVVTLEVTREQAETLAMISQMGEISLTLRRIGEQDTPETLKTPITSEARTSEVFRKLQGGAGPSGTVRVYNGNNVQNLPIRQGGSSSSGY